VWEKTYPQDPIAHNNLGKYAATGQFEEALAEYERAVQLAPSVASYANVMGIQLSLNPLRLISAAVHPTRNLHIGRPAIPSLPFSLSGDS